MTNAQKQHAKYSAAAASCLNRLRKCQADYESKQDKSDQQAQAISRKLTLWQSKYEVAADLQSMWRLAVDLESLGQSGEISMIGRGSVAF